MKNEYPQEIIDKEIDRFIKNRQQQPINTESSQQEEPTQKQKRFIVLPYCNYKADGFAEKLTKLVNNTFEQVDFKIAFTAPNEIGKMFPFKDNIRDKQYSSLVVYKIRCETCNQSYIGKTVRILAHRIKEHNNPNSESAIQTHKRENPTHKIDASNVEILDRADNNFKLMLKEMLHINTLKPELNTQHAASYKNRNNRDMYKCQLKTVIIARQA